MARLARVKIEDSGAYYHLCARTGGPIDEYPLDDKHCRRKIIELILFFSNVYCCRVLGFCVMGNHYHLIVRMDKPRPLTRDALRKRASLLYKDSLVNAWPDARWKQIEKRVFQVSELMRSLQSTIARWYNAAYNRRGRFWADRFKSVLLEDEKTAFDCLLYVELNPVRAGIVRRPENFDGASIYYRERKDDKWMMPLTEITGKQKRADAMRDYKSRMYFRGNVPIENGRVSISKRLLAEEEARGFTTEGQFKERNRQFTDGVAIGSSEYVRNQLDRLRKSGQYLRRKNPIVHSDGAYTTLRPQREKS